MAEAKNKRHALMRPWRWLDEMLTYAFLPSCSWFTDSFSQLIHWSCFYTAKKTFTAFMKLFPFGLCYLMKFNKTIKKRKICTGFDRPSTSFKVRSRSCLYKVRTTSVLCLRTSRFQFQVTRSVFLVFVSWATEIVRTCPTRSVNNRQMCKLKILYEIECFLILATLLRLTSVT